MKGKYCGTNVKRFTTVFQDFSFAVHALPSWVAAIVLYCIALYWSLLEC